MAEFDKPVNDIIDAILSRYTTSIGHVNTTEDRKKEFIREKSALQDLLKELKHLRAITKPVPKTLGDISDLPEELRAELSALKTDDVEDQIFTIINSCEDKEANIDTILVELYRRFQGIHKRTYITNKLWRMVNKSEVLWNGPSGKGYYTTEEPIHPALVIDDENPFGDASKLIDDEEGSITVPF